MAPADGMTATFERFEARPCGSFRLVLTHTDGSSAPGRTTPDSDVVEARYLDLAEYVER